MTKCYLSRCIFLVIMLHSCNIDNKNLQTNKSQLESLKSKIEIHNCNCDCYGSQLMNFETSVIELEKFISKMKKTDNTILIRKQIGDYYNHLSSQYRKKNSAKSDLYLDKRIQTLKDIISIGKYDPSFNKAYKELIKAYQEKKSNLTDFDPRHEFYDQLISKKPKVTNSERIFNYQLTKTMSSLLQRANNKQLTEEDKNYFNKAVLKFLNNDIDSFKYKRSEGQYAIDLMSTVIANYQLDDELIKKVRSQAIIAKAYGFPYKEKELESIIWWCEVRSIEDTIELMRFLNQQMLSNNQKAALQMLTELGKVDEIKSWSDILEYEIPQELFDESIKQAKKVKVQLKKQ